MSLDGPEGLEERRAVGKKKRKRGPVGTLTSLVCKYVPELPKGNLRENL